MKKYTIKRILTSLFTLLAILLVLFILMQLMPGSPFNDEKLTADMRAALYAKYGLDQPIYIQFFRYVGNMLRGDLGVSYNISKNTPISQLIQSRLPISIQIGGMAVTLGALVGLVLGIIAALKRDTIFDTIATIISVIGVSVPSYVFALALSYTFGFRLRWFPMLFSAKDVLGSSVLPSVSLSMFTMASIARFTRSEMIEVLDSDYMLLAESKGISGPASPRRCCASPLAEGGGPQGRRERAFPQAGGRHTHAGRACPAPTAVSSRGREVTPMLNDTFPLRVEAIPAAHASEWRADDSFPPSETQAWQLIFVRSGTIEERCDARHVLLRAGGLLFHQPGEVFAMTTVGEVPPETLRIDFYCTGAAMDRFRGAMLHT